MDEIPEGLEDLLNSIRGDKGSSQSSAIVLAKKETDLELWNFRSVGCNSLIGFVNVFIKIDRIGVTVSINVWFAECFNISFMKRSVSVG